MYYFAACLNKIRFTNVWNQPGSERESRSIMRSIAFYIRKVVFINSVDSLQVDVELAADTGASRGRRITGGGDHALARSRSRGCAVSLIAGRWSRCHAVLVADAGSCSGAHAAGTRLALRGGRWRRHTIVSSAIEFLQQKKEALLILSSLLNEGCHLRKRQKTHQLMDVLDQNIYLTRGTKYRYLQATVCGQNMIVNKVRKVAKFTAPAHYCCGLKNWSLPET